MPVILPLIFLTTWIQGAKLQPFTPTAAVVKFDEIELYSVGYAYRGKAEQRFPVGWRKGSDRETGVHCSPAGMQSGRPAILMHCPWRNGTGVTFQEFAISLPQCQRISVRGAVAMMPETVGKSDGTTFRVVADGRKRFELHYAGAPWREFACDLTDLAGKTVVIRFEVDPGPQDSSAYDHALWADRELVLEGYTPKPVRHPAPLRLDPAKVTSTQNGSVVPLVAFSGNRTVQLKDDVAVLRYAGPDGNLDYQWHPPQTNDDPLFGFIGLSSQQRRGRSFEVSLAVDADLQWTEQAESRTNFWETAGDGMKLVRLFKLGNHEAKVTTTGHIEGKSLVLDVECDQPVISLLQAGRWGPVAHRQQVPVPYYSGRVDYLPDENLFVNSFLDWTSSAASWQRDTEAHYGALTDGSRHKVKERIIYAVSWHLGEVLPNIPNPPSPYITELRNKVVLDIWGGKFTNIAPGFETLTDYGIGNCVALIHDWQRSGYDNALPMHYPAQAGLGGDEGMKTLVSTGTRLGYFVALHENYVDYYPNYDHFDENDIALDSRGERILAWYNPGTKIQSFAEKSNAILRLAGTQSPEIHRRYGTNANYLDVHSCVPPWFHVDFRASEEGAGRMQRVWDVHRELWQYERRTHGGPVFGEGNNHWYWSGHLDGVEAQFGSGWPHREGLTAPLLVDFDLLKIHPLQFNHGMGYYQRWWTNAVWGAVPPMVVLDQYRLQEIAYGHQGFIGSSIWDTVPLAWLEHHLVTPVTARYATANPTDIAYEVNGRWVDSTAAAKAANWRRVRIRYDNGLTVTANDDDSPLRAGDHVLPRFGWLAEGAGVTAYTALRDGAVVDYAETADSVFANARNVADWNLLRVRRVRPSVGEFAQVAPRKFRVTYHWQVNDPVPADYHPFVHFDPADQPGEILFQQDHGLATPTGQWKPGTTVNDGPHTITIPGHVADGDYVWSTGLFKPGEPRLTLEGVDDGADRIRLGVLRVRDGGQTITFDVERATGVDRVNLYRRHLNKTGRVVDFGTIRTDGSVLVRREGGEWVLQTWPRDKSFTLELNARHFGKPTEIGCVGGPTEAVASGGAGKWWSLPLNGSRQYRWPAN